MKDYEKLFREGNIIALRNTEQDYIFYHQVHTHEMEDILDKDYAGYMRWDEYMNPNLSSGHFEIVYIWEPNSNSEEKLSLIYDKSKDPDVKKEKPKLENGMFVAICSKDYNNKWEYRDFCCGVIVNNIIVLDEGHFIYLSEVDQEEVCTYSPWCVVGVYDSKFVRAFSGCKYENLLWVDDAFDFDNVQNVHEED